MSRPDTPEESTGSSANPGDMIDRCKLLQPIGEGEFGTVRMAEQNERLPDGVRG